ncbi:MAG: CHASE domain-containing protein [Pseudomonadota bacterium]
MRTQGYLAFVVGMCLTVGGCLLVVDAQQAAVRSNFQRDTDKVASDVSVRLQIYFDMLLSMKGMFAINGKVDRAQFNRFVHELNLSQRYPGFQAIQFVRQVGANELDDFSAAVRADTSLAPEGYPGFTIHPQLARDQHFIIEYTEPLKGNENAFGLDLAALAPHRIAIEAGRDSGAIVATERITLVQDRSGQAGFVARAPVYRQGMPTTSVAERRAAFLGLVAIVFRVDHLMREVVDPGLQEHLAIRVHDAGLLAMGADMPASQANLMYDTTKAWRHLVPGLQAVKRIEVGQRAWEIGFGAVAGGRYSRDPSTVLLVAIGGMLVSGLFAALLTASGRSRSLAAQVKVALDEQRAFQDSASVGLALFSNGQIMRCNRGMEEMMGYGIGELTGNPTSVLTARGGSAATEIFTLDPLTGRSQGEYQLARKDGSAIWCLVSGKALASGQGGQGVWVIQDISDRKQTEAALVDAKDGLEHSLAELAHQKANVESAHSDLSSVLLTLKQAQTNLITSEKMASLGSLVAGIAHELNTPIGNSLLTATALADLVAEFEKQYVQGGVKRSSLETLMADTKLACGIMANSLRRAADLITSFKQVAVDQTSDKRRRFELAEVVHDTLATFQAQLRRANCEARVDCPPKLALDSYPGSVGQILSNLINNALLHAFEGRASATISISARELDDEQVLLVFADDGVGMPPKILHQVFDPFFTTKMGQGGSGLGMNIVYNIVTGVLGGTIALESSAEHGTSVTIRMPRRAPQRDTDDADLRMLQL